MVAAAAADHQAQAVGDHTLQVQAIQAPEVPEVQSQMDAPTVHLTELPTVCTVTQHTQTLCPDITRTTAQTLVRHTNHFTHIIDHFLIIMQLGMSLPCTC